MPTIESSVVRDTPSDGSSPVPTILRTLGLGAIATGILAGLLAFVDPTLADDGGSGAVVYVQTRNGEVTAGEAGRILIQQGALSRLFTEVPGTPIPSAPEELSYFDLAARATRETARFPDGSRCTVSTDFDSLAQFVITGERKTILGHECTKATTEIRSNRIEVWFTRDAGIVGSPSLRLFIPGALILETVQNGSRGLVAETISIEPGSSSELLAHQPRPFVPADWGEEVDAAEYRFRVTDSYVTKVNVFSDEQISFGNEIENPADPESRATFRFSKGTVIARRVRLPEMDENTMVLAELTEVSNGDAYDRTGSVFLIPTDRALSYLDGLRDSVGVLPVVRSGDEEYQGIVASDGYLPPLELIRFITPFGVGHFGERSRVHGLQWEDEASYVMDLTELLPRLQGDVWIGVFIGNYDKGGHRVSLELRYYPWSRVVSTEPRTAHWTLPLFNTVNAMEMSGQNYGTLFGTDTLRVEFDAPEGVTSCQLRYITTGHGGWGGGDEFNHRENEIFLDGERIAGFVPWRSDCGTFRNLNPSSGNFWNGLSSSDFSRSGWCPGTTVSPVVIPLGGLPAGRHRIEVAIPMGPREGGSFSSWNVSGVLVGELGSDPP